MALSKNLIVNLPASFGCERFTEKYSVPVLPLPPAESEQRSFDFNIWCRLGGAAGFGCAKRFAAAAGAAGFPLLKRLPVSAVRRDSQRLAQQASRCSKGCRFCLHEEIHGGGRRSRLPVVKKAAGFACAKRFAAGAAAASFPLLKKEEK